MQVEQADVFDGVDAGFAFVEGDGGFTAIEHASALGSAVVVLGDRFGIVLHPEERVTVGVDAAVQNGVEHGASGGRRALHPLGEGATASVGVLVCGMVGCPEIAELCVGFVG